MAKNIWIGSLLILLFLPLFGQEQAEKFRLIHSDKLYLTKVLDEKVMELRGKVHFWYGENEFKCDRALLFDQQKIARLDGRVEVNNDSLFLSADSLAYYRLAGELNAGGRVYITETGKDGSFRWFRSEYATFNEKDNNLTVWRNVSSYDKEENASVTCGYAYWDRKNGYAYMIEEPRVQAAKEDTLYVSADKIEFFDEERKLVATFNVVAQTQDYKTSSDFLIYFMKEDKAVFTGEPKFVSDFATASAREFYLYFEDRILSRAELVDSCLVEFSEERGGERNNWVKANFITLAFNKDAIQNFHAENGVDYYFTQEKTEDRDFFINHATGDFLDAKFDLDNKLDFMQMRKGIKGIYRFHNNS